MNCGPFDVAQVLVHMAAGGVGVAVSQLCRTVPDVTVYGTCSASKHDFARRQGCTMPIDYHTTDYAEEVQRATHHRGVHIVLDPLGGEDVSKNSALAGPLGYHILFGGSNFYSCVALLS